MAKGRKTGGKDFPKGVCPNPEGRPPLSPDAKAFRRLTQTEVIELISELKDATLTEIEDALRDSETPAMKAWLCRVFLEGIEGGDIIRLNAVWDRVLGKPKQALEHSGRDGGPIETRDASSLTDEQLDGRILALAQKIKGQS